MIKSKEKYDTLSLVSIIIPIYNSENHIGNTLQSVLSQSYDNIEIIIIDDGSSDNSLKVVNNILQESKFKFKVLIKENGGVSSARNLGIKNSNGKYIYILDSDDLIDENLINEMVRKMEEDRSDFVFCGFDKIDEYGKKINKYTQLYKYVEKKTNNKDIIRKYLKEELWVCTISGMYKKQIIDKKNILYNETCSNGEDQEFCLKYLANINSVSCINKSLAFYVQHTNSISNGGNIKKFTALGATKRIIKYYKQVNMDLDIIEMLELNKYQREFLRNFNSMIKSNENKIYIEKIINNKIFLKNLKKYKLINNTKSEKIFLLRYNAFKKFPNLYVSIMKMYYK